MNEEICGYGVVHAIILRMLCVDYQNGREI